jgi:hypothetical protein
MQLLGKATQNKWKIMLRCRTYSKIISLKVTQHKKLSITKGGNKAGRGERAFVEIYVYGVVQAGFGRLMGARSGIWRGWVEK